MSGNRVPGRTGRGMGGLRSATAVAEIPASKPFFRHLRDERGIERSRRSVAPEWATKLPDLQDVFYGSDGTRTRDLRRDRPSPGTTTPGDGGALNMFICSAFRFAGWHRSAWLSQSSNRRLGHEWASKSCLNRQRALEMRARTTLASDPAVAYRLDVPSEARSSRSTARASSTRDETSSLRKAFRR